MTRRCEISKIGIDLPCDRRSTHSLKFVSKKLGDKRKFKILICDLHYNILDKSDKITHLLEDKTKLIEYSEDWEANLR